MSNYFEEMLIAVDEVNELRSVIETMAGRMTHIMDVKNSKAAMAEHYRNRAEAVGKVARDYADIVKAQDAQIEELKGMLAQGAKAL